MAIGHSRSTKPGFPICREHIAESGADLRTACVELHRQRQAAIRPAVRFSPMPAVAKIIGDYSEFLDAIRARVDEMGMTRLELDHQAGLQDGYSGKTLGPAKIRSYGMRTLGPTLGALGLKMVLIEDTAQTGKILARRQPRERPVRQSPAQFLRPISRAIDPPA
jgi:hypothetical protein